MARTAGEKQVIVAEVRALLSAGASEFDQLAALVPHKVNKRELRGLRNEIITSEIEELKSSSAGEIFLRHKLRMDACVKSLDEVVERALAPAAKVAPGALNAAVAAIKAKAQILDQTLDRGQSLGVIHEAPKVTARIGGLDISEAKIADLRVVVAKKVAALQLLATSGGVGSYVDEPDGDLYYDAPPSALPVIDVVDAVVVEVKPKVDARPVRQKVLLETA